MAEREAFRDIFSQVEPEKLIFLDESGLHLGMTPLYGRSFSFERVKDLTPFNKGIRVTMIAAIGILEVKTALYGTWHLDGDIFTTFVKDCLVPVLQPGQIIIMDNLKTHKIAYIKELIEAAGASLVYLPPYSPDMTPIELCWSKIKTYIRKHKARTLKALGKAIKEAFKTITSYDLEGWFGHCGYYSMP